MWNKIYDLVCQHSMTELLEVGKISPKIYVGAVADYDKNSVNLKWAFVFNSNGKYCGIHLARSFIPHVIAIPLNVLRRVTNPPQSLVSLSVHTEELNSFKLKPNDVIVVDDEVKDFFVRRSVRNLKQFLRNALRCEKKVEIFRDGSLVYSSAKPVVLPQDNRVRFDLALIPWHKHVVHKERRFSSLVEYMKENKMIRRTLKLDFGGLYLVYKVDSQYTLSGMINEATKTYTHYVLTKSGLDWIYRLVLDKVL